MATIKTKKTRAARKTDRVGDMTVAELRELIQETVGQILADWIDDHESDEGLAFTPEIAARLEIFLRDKPRGIPLKEVKRRLGIDD